MSVEPPLGARLSGDSHRHFFRLWLRVERGEPTALARYADGEHLLMTGSAIPPTTTVGVEEGWWAEAGESHLGPEAAGDAGHGAARHRPRPARGTVRASA